MEKVDEALQDVWNQVVDVYTNSVPQGLEPFNTTMFRIRLEAGITKAAHDRYQNAWVKRRGK